MSEQDSQLTEQVLEILHAIPRQASESLDPLTQQDVSDRVSDRQLKQRHATRFFWLLLAQLSVMNIVFVFTGIGWLEFPQYLMHLYMGGTLLQIFGVVLIITKHLFKI